MRSIRWPRPWAFRAARSTPGPSSFRPGRCRGERMKPERQRAWRRGRKAESLALLALRLVGYRILARDHRTALGEIDIIARRGTILAFVEVKARADVTAAAESLLARQRRRIARAAAGYLA